MHASRTPRPVPLYPFSLCEQCYICLFYTRVHACNGQQGTGRPLLASLSPWAVLVPATFCAISCNGLGPTLTRFNVFQAVFSCPVLPSSTTPGRFAAPGSLFACSLCAVHIRHYALAAPGSLFTCSLCVVPLHRSCTTPGRCSAPDSLFACSCVPTHDSSMMQLTHPSCFIVAECSHVFANVGLTT